MLYISCIKNLKCSQDLLMKKRTYYNFHIVQFNLAYLHEPCNQKNASLYKEKNDVGREWKIDI